MPFGRPVLLLGLWAPSAVLWGCEGEMEPDCESGFWVSSELSIPDLQPGMDMELWE